MSEQTVAENTTVQKLAWIFLKTPKPDTVLQGSQLIPGVKLLYKD